MKHPCQLPILLFLKKYFYQTPFFPLKCSQVIPSSVFPAASVLPTGGKPGLITVLQCQVVTGTKGQQGHAERLGWT